MIYKIYIERGLVRICYTAHVDAKKSQIEKCSKVRPMHAIFYTMNVVPEWNILRCKTYVFLQNRRTAPLLTAYFLCFGTANRDTQGQCKTWHGPCYSDFRRRE